MHITDTFAVVSFDAELAAHYIHFDPTPGQFSLEKPYQASFCTSKNLKAEQPNATEGTSLADLAAQRPTCSRGAVLTLSEHSENLDTKTYNPEEIGSSPDIALTGGPSVSTQQGSCPDKRAGKRRRKNSTRSCSAGETSLREVREQEAAERHTASLPALSAAVSSFQAWLVNSAFKTVAEAAGGKHRPKVASVNQSSLKPLLGDGAGPAAEPATSSQSPAIEAVGVIGRSENKPAYDIGRQYSQPKGKCNRSAADFAQEEGGQPASTRQPTNSASESLPSTPGNGPQAFDLTGLAELQAVLKPKFCFLDNEVAELVPDDQSWRLFGQVIENPQGKERVANAHDQEVLMPARSRFLLGDVEHFDRLIPAAQDEGFQCVVADPPWENKSASRGQKYPTLPSRRLLSIPVRQLLHKEGGLVALWVTNRERLRRFVEQELLPAWGLVLLALWFWVKVTDGGELVGPLDITHRKPYEVILLAAPPGWRPARPIPDHFVIFAVPGQHSRKPHLGRLLAPYLPSLPRCLELFARELARGWTSCGNEVLAFQCLRFFRDRLPA